MRRALSVVALLVVIASGVVAVSGCGHDDSPKTPTAPPLVSGLSVNEVAIYQGVKASLMKAGAAATPAVPVIAGRAGLLRVYFQPPTTWLPHEIIVHIGLAQKGVALPPLEQKFMVIGNSSDATIATTVNFDLPPATLTPDLSWSITLKEEDTTHPVGDTSGARYPATGEAAIGAIKTGKVKVTLLPVSYGADGSMRMPSVAATDVAKFRAKMQAMYPVTDVEITVGTPFSWMRPIAADGTGWDELLNAVVSQRLRDGAPDDVYYYGLFTPMSSFMQYCHQGCVLGLSPLAFDAQDGSMRASIGLGYEDTYAEPQETFVHEVGHAHGRMHAPCETQDADPDFPYSNGQIGSWGYDSTSKKFFDPAGKMRDMMGYCSPDWISDYTYSALATRVQSVNTVPQNLETESHWRQLLVKANGRVERGEIFSTRHAPTGQVKAIERFDGSGASTLVDARFYPFDHLPGGILMMPAADDLGTLRVDGKLVE